MTGRLYLALAVTLTAHARAADNEPVRPNVVIVLSDDQGWGDLSANGNTNLSTPRVDSLARDGARFERFYVCPVCSPTRAEFLTGRYHPRGGVHGVSTGAERLDTDEKTLADVFKSAGYATAAFGKWHNGSQYPYHPLARGFETYYGFTSGHWGDYFDPPLEQNGTPVRGRGYITDDLTDHAVAFVREHHDRPFVCYLALNTPHSPMQVPDRFFDRFRDAEVPLRYQGPQREDVANTRAALAMCENIDWNVGRVLDALDELKLAERTVVVYFCDNGPASWRWNGGMRGRKGTTDEGGVRSPLFVRWPGHVPPGTRVEPVTSAADLLPTLAALAGVPITPRPGKALDGLSLAPLLLGRTPGPEHDRVIVSHWNGQLSARSLTHRLDAAGRLYDMAADPGQSRDVASDQPAALARLKDAVARYRSEVLSELPARDDRPFPVGHRELPVTYLPARDGVAHGHVRRSASAPNCSYFTGMTDPSDSITWDVSVATPGRYEAVVYHTCTAADVGCTVELSFADRRVSTRATAAHDPPLVGAEHDRVPRQGESYVKDFAPLRLGTFDLPASRSLLTLRAPEIPGKQAVDVRMVVLTLVTPASVDNHRPGSEQERINPAEDERHGTDPGLD
jgi:arylsulfatase A-like enzyme